MCKQEHLYRGSSYDCVNIYEANKYGSFLHIQRALSTLRKSQEDILQLLEIWRPQPRNRIPPRSRIEPIGPTTRVVTDSDIIKRIRVAVESWVQESHWALARRDTRLVEQRHDAGKDGRRGAGAADAVGRAVEDGGDLEADGSHVRETPGIATVIVHIGPVGRCVFSEEILDG